MHSESLEEARACVWESGAQQESLYLEVSYLPLLSLPVFRPKAFQLIGHQRAPIDRAWEGTQETEVDVMAQRGKNMHTD